MRFTCDFLIIQLDAEEEELLLHYRKMWAHHFRLTVAVCKICRKPIPSAPARKRPKDIIVSIRKEVVEWTTEYKMAHLTSTIVFRIQFSNTVKILIRVREIES